MLSSPSSDLSLPSLLQGRSDSTTAVGAEISGLAGRGHHLFLDHFQNMARGHFIVRRLEREFGDEVVREEYELAAGEMGFRNDSETESVS